MFKCIPENTSQILRFKKNNCMSLKTPSSFEFENSICRTAEN